LRLTEEAIGERAEKLKQQIRNARLKIDVVEARSVIGGGSAPGSTLSTRVLAVSSAEIRADEIAQKLREWATPVIARVEEGRVVLDLRTVAPERDGVILAALESLAPA